MSVDKSVPSDVPTNPSFSNRYEDGGTGIPVVAVELNGVTVSMQDPDAKAKIAAELEKLAAAEKAK